MRFSKFVWIWKPNLCYLVNRKMNKRRLLLYYFLAQFPEMHVANPTISIIITYSHLCLVDRKQGLNERLVLLALVCL